MSAGDGARAGRTALGVLAVCFVLNMLGRGLGDAYAVFLLPIEREFGWSRSELTSVYSLFLVVSGFAAACAAPSMETSMAAPARNDPLRAPPQAGAPRGGFFSDRISPRLAYRCHHAARARACDTGFERAET